MCVCTCVLTCSFVCVHVEVSGQYQVTSPGTLSTFFGTSSLTGLELTMRRGWPEGTRPLPASTSPALGFQVCTITSGIFAWVLEVELSPQSTDHLPCPEEAIAQ